MANVLNPHYLDTKILEKARTLFHSSDMVPSILLSNFFEKSFFLDVQKKLKTIPWIKETQPLLHRYHHAVVPQALSEVFSSEEFLSIVSTLVGISRQQIKGIDVAVYAFCWKEYTLLHDTLVEEPGFDFIVDLTSRWDPLWGGVVYYADGSGDFTSLPVLENSFVVVQRKEGVQKFVKYVNHHAGEVRRLFVFGTLRTH